MSEIQPSKETHYRIIGGGDDIWVYQGIDTYLGEQTYMFRNTASGRLSYQKPENWSNSFAAYHEAIAALQPVASSAEREELAKWCERHAVAMPEDAEECTKIAALLRTPVAVDDAMVKASAKAIAKHDAPGAVWRWMHPTWRSKYKQLAKDGLEAALQAGRK